MESKINAQHRVEQIDSFHREFKILLDEEVIRLSANEQLDIQNYHTKLKQELSQTFDVDTHQSQKQLSLGMKIAALFGSLAIGASLFFFFYRYWGLLSTTLQVLVLTVTPLGLAGLTQWCLVRDKSGYFAKLAAVLCMSSFVLNLSMMGQIFNITPTENAMLVWSLFALGLAYLTYSRVLLTFALLFLASFLSAKMGTWSGIYWLYFGQRPEHLILAGVLLFGIGCKAQKDFYTFPPTIRLLSTLIVLLPMMVMANWGRVSYLSWQPEVVEYFYQVLGFVLSATLIWFGIRRNWSETINCGTVFFTLFLYTKFYDWWWDWFPKYLFFLVIALCSMFLLLVFKRLRKQLVITQEVSYA